MRRTRAHVPAAWLLAGLLAAAAPHAAAQTRNELPASVIESGSIGQGEQAEITRFVSGLTPAATGAEGDATTRARRELVAPLVGRRPSVAFRQAYGQAVSPLVATLVGSDDPAAQIAGLRVAGNLATAEGATVVRNALGSTDDGVRLFAAVQARRVFEVTASAGPALTETQTAQLVDALAESVTPDREPAYVQTVIRALGAGASLRASDMAQTRSRSLAALAQVARRTIDETRPADLLAHENTLLLATSLATRSVSEAGVGVNDGAAKASAELGAEILALMLGRQSEGRLEQPSEADLRLVNAAESLVYFARRRQAENARANANAIPQTRLAELLQARDRGFRNELVRLIGPGSDMLRQFGLPDDRFIQ